MKIIKITFVLFLLAIFISSVRSQTDTSIMINPVPKMLHGQSYYATNIYSYLLGGETIAESKITADLVFNLNPSGGDTIWKKNEQVPKEHYQYGYIENKYPFIMGNDTFPEGKVAGRIVYLLNPPEEFSTSTSHTWSANQLFSKIFVDTLIVNKIDSVTSTYWINSSGDTIAFVDATRDSISFKKLYVKDLSGQTIVTSNSVTTNTLYSDTIIGHSPIFLFADSVVTQHKAFIPHAIVDTISTKQIGKSTTSGIINFSGTNILEFIPAGSPRYYMSDAAFYPYLTDNYDIGKYNNRFKNIYGRTGNYDSLRISYINTSSITYPSTFTSYFGGATTYVENTTSRMFIGINNTGIMDMRPAGIISYQIIYPNANNSVDLGKATNTWANIYAGTRIYSPTATFSALPEYEDNAAAITGGLTTGMLYRTGTGQVMIVF